MTYPPTGYGPIGGSSGLLREQRGHGSLPLQTKLQLSSQLQPIRLHHQYPLYHTREGGRMQTEG